MILLAALAASVLPNVLRHARSGNYGSPVERGGNGCGLSRPACWQFIYSRVLFGTMMLASLGPVIISAVVRCWLAI